MRFVLLLLTAGCALEPPGVPTHIDDDGDGFATADDCNDSDPQQFPGAEWPLDADGDGWQSGTAVSCEPPAGVLVGTSLGEDCDDTDPNANALLTGYPDADGDGFGAGTPETFCGPLPLGVFPDALDCDDAHPRAYPGAPEDCGIADLDCTPDNDPSCRISGTIVLQITGNEWYAEIGVTPPELDLDARADAILLGDYVIDTPEVTARWYDLDDSGNVAAPREYTSDSVADGYSLEFIVLPDLDGDGTPEVWLAQGDYDDPESSVWDVALVATGQLQPADAFLSRALGDPFATVAGAWDAAEDLHPDAGVEVALRAFDFSQNGRVEIWGGFAGAPSILSLVTGPSGGGYFGADVLASDLDGDGVVDLAVTRSAEDWTEEAMYIFHGPFSTDRNADDADATYQLAGGSAYTLGQVEPAGELLGDGRAWLWWGAPNADFGGRAWALPGTAVTLGTEDPLLVESRGITGTLAYPGFGAAMDSVGDQTGDGVPDVLVGAPDWFGPEDGAFLLDSNVVAFGGTSWTVDSPGVVAARFESALRFGYVVSSAGDVNGDGGEDVWIGADGPAFLIDGGLQP